MLPGVSRCSRPLPDTTEAPVPAQCQDGGFVLPSFEFIQVENVVKHFFAEVGRFTQVLLCPLICRQQLSFFPSDLPVTDVSAVDQPRDVGDANSADQLPTVATGLPSHVESRPDTVLRTAPHDRVGFGVVLDAVLVASSGRHITEAPRTLTFQTARTSRLGAVVTRNDCPMVRADQDRAHLLPEAVPSTFSGLCDPEEVAVPARTLVPMQHSAGVTDGAAQSSSSSNSTFRRSPATVSASISAFQKSPAISSAMA